MNEHEALGCGHFSESDWADLFMTAGPDEDAGASDETTPAPVETLRAHMQSCAACRAEWRAFASIGFAIRDSVRAERPTKETFVDGVLAATGRTDRKSVVEGKRVGLGWRRVRDEKERRTWA